jgi:hypothetical protein
MPWKQVHFSLGAPLGNLEGIRWLGLFEKKGQYIWVPFLGTFWEKRTVYLGSFLGDFLRKKDSISGFLSWTQRILRY